MKHVIHVALAHTGEDSRVFYRECVSLARKYRVTLVCIGDITKTFHKSHVEVFQIQRTSAIVLFLVYLRNIYNLKPDLIHAHEIESFILALILKVFRPRTNIIFDVHEFFDVYIRDQNRIFVKRIYYWVYSFILRPLFLRFCDGVITVSPIMKQQYAVWNNCVEVIYNFPEFALFDSIKTNTALDAQYIYLTYHGGITESRGILRYIDLIAALDSKYRLLIIGGMSDDVYKKVQVYLKKSNVQDKVMFTGKLHLRETIEYLKNDVMKIGVFLPDTSGQFSVSYPIKVFEYIALGIPQICSRHIDIFHETNKDKNIGISVDYENVDEQVQSVNAIVEAYTDFKNSVLRQREIYSWKTEEEKLYALYTRIMKKTYVEET